MESVPTARSADKRVVVRHASGLYEILGLWQNLPGHNAPQFVPNALLFGPRRAYGIDLTRVSERAWWYDEVVAPIQPHVEPAIEPAIS